MPLTAVCYSLTDISLNSMAGMVGICICPGIIDCWEQFERNEYVPHKRFTGKLVNNHNCTHAQTGQVKGGDLPRSVHCRAETVGCSPDSVPPYFMLVCYLYVVAVPDFEALFGKPYVSVLLYFNGSSLNEQVERAMWCHV